MTGQARSDLGSYIFGNGIKTLQPYLETTLHVATLAYRKIHPLADRTALVPDP